MKGFRRFLAEMTHYHGTTKANADSILRTGLDPKRYQSGMFRGVYLTPNLDYFGGRQPEAILAVELDDSAVLDVRDVTDADLEAIDPGYRSMSYGYRNSLIEKKPINGGWSKMKKRKF